MTTLSNKAMNILFTDQFGIDPKTADMLIRQREDDVKTSIPEVLKRLPVVEARQPNTLKILKKVARDAVLKALMPFFETADKKAVLFTLNCFAKDSPFPPSLQNIQKPSPDKAEVLSQTDKITQNNSSYISKETGQPAQKSPPTQSNSFSDPNLKAKTPPKKEPTSTKSPSPHPSDLQTTDKNLPSKSASEVYAKKPPPAGKSSWFAVPFKVHPDAKIYGSTLDGSLTYNGQPWPLVDKGLDNITRHLSAAIGKNLTVNKPILAQNLSETASLYAKGELDPSARPHLWRLFHLSNGTKEVFDKILNDTTVSSLRSLGVIK